MSDVGTFALSKEWKERLGLANRSSTEFYESAEAVTDTPHAGAIRSALENLGLSAIFSVQGVLTIAILSVDQSYRSINMIGTKSLTCMARSGTRGLPASS